MPEASRLDDLPVTKAKLKSALEPGETPNALAPVPLYAITPVKIIGESERFYDAPDELIVDTLRRVVACEAPVHLLEAARRVAAHWQMNRVGNRIRERVQNAARRLAQQGAISIVEDFLWHKDQQHAPVRSRALPDYEFEVEQICPAEFVAAALMALRAHGPRMMNELVAEVARLMGYDRTGRRLSEQITTAIESLVHQGRLRAVATGIQIAESE